MHSKRRNRLGQHVVQTLVRSHTNLVLQRQIARALDDVLDWDIELVFPEPTSNDQPSDDEGSDDEEGADSDESSDD